MNDSAELKTETITLNFGPQHPATHGTLRIELELDGEVIVRAEPEIGFLHTGFEKLGEYLSYDQYVCVTDRMNYFSSLNNNIAFTLSAEKLFDIEVTKRAEYVRVIMAELSRISDHLLCLGAMALDLGAFTAFLYFFQEREKCYNLFEMVTGTRLTTGYTRLGGVMRDFSETFYPAVRDFMKNLPGVIREVEVLLNRNKIFLNRTRGIGVLAPDEAINYGWTGPCLRSTGVEWDIRKAEPYSSYEDFEFDVPVGENGDVYDRYLVRMEEMRQSLRIVDQALNSLPAGEVNIFDWKVNIPDKEDVYHTMEGLIHHFEIFMENKGYHAPVGGEVYVPTEAPNGELGFYLIGDGTRSAYRVRVRPPSLVNYQPFSEVMKGKMLSDVVAMLSSLNIIAGELDR